MNAPHLAILCDRQFAIAVARFLESAMPGAVVPLAHDLAEIDALVRQFPDLRVLGFVTGTIIPSRLLSPRAFPWYNIHPGPPDFPGIFPEIRATLDRPARFGATLHEMAEKVDSGAIIAVEEMEVAGEPTEETLGLIGFECALVLLGLFAPRIKNAGTALVHSNIQWRGPPMTRAALSRLVGRDL
jgi:methionyl-tRNA formyltransferase